jgi:hypothetical protein
MSPVPAAPMTEEKDGRAVLCAIRTPAAPCLPPGEGASVPGDTGGNPPKARVAPGFPRTPFPPLPTAQGRAPHATIDSHTAPTPVPTETSSTAPTPLHRPHP